MLQFNFRYNRKIFGNWWAWLKARIPTWVELVKHVTAKVFIDLHKMNDEKAPLVPPRYLKPRSWLKRDCCPCIPARYVLAVMSSLGFVNVYALRVNLSVAIVEMSNDTATLRNGSARVNKLDILVTFGLFRPQTIQGSLGSRPIK